MTPVTVTVHRKDGTLVDYEVGPTPRQEFWRWRTGPSGLTFYSHDGRRVDVPRGTYIKFSSTPHSPRIRGDRA